MIGERLRELRRAQGRSLADVAAKANVSVATLSRVENDKQSVELRFLMRLARILKVAPSDLLAGQGRSSGNGDSRDPLARRIADLNARERAALWRKLAGTTRASRAGRKPPRMASVAQQVDELLAQLEFVRAELEILRKSVKHR